MTNTEIAALALLLAKSEELAAAQRDAGKLAREISELLTWRDEDRLELAECRRQLADWQDKEGRARIDRALARSAATGLRHELAEMTQARDAARAALEATREQLADARTYGRTLAVRLAEASERADQLEQQAASEQLAASLTASLFTEMTGVPASADELCVYCHGTLSPDNRTGECADCVATAEGYCP